MNSFQQWFSQQLVNRGFARWNNFNWLTQRIPNPLHHHALGTPTRHTQRLSLSSLLSDMHYNSRSHTTVSPLQVETEKSFSVSLDFQGDPQLAVWLPRLMKSGSFCSSSPAPASASSLRFQGYEEEHSRAEMLNLSVHLSGLSPENVLPKSSALQTDPGNPASHPAQPLSPASFILSWE